MTTEVIDNFVDTESIKNAIEEAKTNSKGLKVEVLKHYLINFNLYQLLPEEEKENSIPHQRLKECTVLYKKIIEIEKVLTNKDTVKKAIENRSDRKTPDRKAVGEVKRNNSKKGNSNKTKNAKQRYGKNYEKQKEELKKEMENPKKRVKKY